MFHTRSATPLDAKALSALAERTFRDTFEGDNSPEDMALHCRDTYGEAIQREELRDPGRVTLVAEASGELIGYAQVRRGPAPVCVRGDAPGEIQRLYVARSWHGRGVAQALMSASLESLAGAGARTAWLGVWERNPRAIAFYRKFRFEEVGDHIFAVGRDPQRDIVMARPLTGDGAEGGAVLR